MTSRLDWIQEEIDALKEAGLYNRIRTIESPQGAWLVVDGKRVLNFCSNNYLGFANHPRLVKAAQQAIAEFGVGPGAVRSIAGTMSLHLELERRLAEFKGVEAAITFQSGFAANQATIPALVGKEDVIYSDELNHASIIDGSRLSGATIVRYNHADVSDLEAKIRENKDKFRRGLAITDGVFSMDGDIARLPDIVKIAKEFGAIVMVDDAHASGVLGRNGRGTVDHFDLHGQVDIQVGTLSKAIGVVGGYVAGSQTLIDYLVHRGRPILFSTSHPPAVTEACIEAFDILLEEPEIIDRLWSNARMFKEGLRRIGFDTGASETPITPIMVGDGAMAMEFSDKLFERGVFVVAVAYPTVPKGKARLRTIVTAAHTEDDLSQALEIIEKSGRELGLV